MLTDKVFVCDLLTVNRKLTLFDVHQLFLLSNIHSTTHFTSVYMYKIISILISNHRRNVKPEDDDDDVTEASTPAPSTEPTTHAHETTLISITTLPQTTELITSTDPSTTTSRVVDATVAMDKVEPRALN